jgi:hypothetical protein
MVRRGQAAYFFISGTIRPSEFAFATSVIDEELDALRKGNLSPDAFDTDRSALIQQLRVSYATPENVESWAGWDFANRDRHRDFPDVLSAFQTVTQQQVANFTSKHFVPEREFNSTISPVPLSQGAVILAGLALLFGTVRLMRLLLTRPVDMRRIRYVAHFRIPKLMYFTLGGMLILTIAIGLRLAWYAFDQFNVAFLFEQNSFVLQWSVWAFFIAGNVVVLIAGLSLVPSKILVFEDRVLIKYVAYRSVAIPTADIATLSLERFPSVWLNRRLWKCVPFKWGLLTPGIYLKRRNSWSYFFDVRNRKELLDLLSMHMTI